jgi:hypothetical protein
MAGIRSKLAKNSLMVSAFMLMIMTGYVAVISMKAMFEGVPIEFRSEAFMAIIFLGAGIVSLIETLWETRKKELKLFEGFQLLICLATLVLGVGYLALTLQVEQGQVLVNMFKDWIWALSLLIFGNLTYEIFINKT